MAWNYALLVRAGRRTARGVRDFAPSVGPSFAGRRDLRAMLRTWRRPWSQRARHGSRAKGAALGPTPGARSHRAQARRYRSSLALIQARALRLSPTLSERKLWSELSGGSSALYSAGRCPWVTGASWTFSLLHSS